MSTLKKPSRPSVKPSRALKARRLKPVGMKRTRAKQGEAKPDISDIPELDDAFWANASLQMPMNKKGVFLRIDPDVLQWFKDRGKGYQTRINAVLRSYVDAQKRAP